MKKSEDGLWYVDQQNNRWSVRYFTKAQAIKNSESLKGCTRCTNCTDCADCTRCTNCTYCADCRGCTDCRDYQNNPQRIVSGQIGDSCRQTTVYWNSKADIQVVCGCFKGNLEEFEEAVRRKYKSTTHEYYKFITWVKLITGAR